MDSVSEHELVGRKIATIDLNFEENFINVMEDESCRHDLEDEFLPVCDFDLVILKPIDDRIEDNGVSISQQSSETVLDLELLSAKPSTTSFMDEDIDYEESPRLNDPLYVVPNFYYPHPPITLPIQLEYGMLVATVEDTQVDPPSIATANSSYFWQTTQKALVQIPSVFPTEVYIPIYSQSYEIIEYEEYANGPYYWNSTVFPSQLDNTEGPMLVEEMEPTPSENSKDVYIQPCPRSKTNKFLNYLSTQKSNTTEKPKPRKLRRRRRRFSTKITESVKTPEPKNIIDLLNEKNFPPLPSKEDTTVDGPKKANLKRNKQTRNLEVPVSHVQTSFEPKIVSNLLHEKNFASLPLKEGDSVNEPKVSELKKKKQQEEGLKESYVQISSKSKDVNNLLLDQNFPSLSLKECNNVDKSKASKLKGKKQKEGFQESQVETSSESKHVINPLHDITLPALTLKESNTVDGLKAAKSKVRKPKAELKVLTGSHVQIPSSLPLNEGNTADEPKTANLKERKEKDDLRVVESHVQTISKTKVVVSPQHNKNSLLLPLKQGNTADAPETANLKRRKRKGNLNVTETNNHSTCYKPLPKEVMTPPHDGNFPPLGSSRRHTTDKFETKSKQKPQKATLVTRAYNQILSSSNKSKKAEEVIKDPNYWHFPLLSLEENSTEKSNLPKLPLAWNRKR